MTLPGLRANPWGSLAILSLGIGIAVDELTSIANWENRLSVARAYRSEHAQRRGIPITALAFDDANLRAVWERDLVLLRPDQHVAWRGDTPPADIAAAFDRITASGVKI